MVAFLVSIIIHKVRGMSWAARVARMREKINASRFSSEGLKEGAHLEEPGINWRMILKWI
jgi:hypothetical protein